MFDPFSEYELRLTAMAAGLPGAERASFEVLRMRLLENVARARLYGDTPTFRSERAVVLDLLNRMAVALLGVPFLDVAGHLVEAVRADLAIFIGLAEEFPIAVEAFGIPFVGTENTGVAVKMYRGSIPSDSRSATQLLLVPAGAMGNTRSAGIVSALLAQIAVPNVVALGIAGSIGTDLQPGDVFIPQSVNEYMANTAGTGTQNLAFQPCGNSLVADPRLLSRTQLLNTDYAEDYARWSEIATQGVRTLISKARMRQLASAGIKLRGQSRVLAGDNRVLASGPAVSKGVAFASWIKTTVRKTEAIEMESAGVFDAALIRTPAPRALALRGISDYGDNRKKVIEEVTHGEFRTLAIKNAVAYLCLAIKAGVFAP